MNSLQIKYFLKAARLLNFTEAAKQLFISQPALSQQITALEQELNMQLFVRRKSKVYLTPGAAVLLEELPKYEAFYNDVIHKAKLANEGMSGVLRIGMLQGQMIEPVLLQTFQRFKEMYPSIGVVLTSDSFQDLRKKLDNDTVDMIYSTGFDKRNHDSYCYQHVGENIPVIYVSKIHPLAGQEVTSMSQLKGYPFITLQKLENEIVTELLKNDCKKAGFIPEFKYADSLDEQALWVEAGEGIGTSNHKAAYLHNPNLQVLKGLKFDHGEMMLCWKKGNINPSIALFQNIIWEELEKSEEADK